VTDTRQRILDAALELFAERGYAGTSVADLARRLEMTKAALYYHFDSKGDILEALVAAPLAGFTALAGTADSRQPEELLGAIVDVTAELYGVSRLLGDDPSVGQALRDRELPRAQEVNRALTEALARGWWSQVRAHAAYGAIKNGTLGVMAATGKPPTREERTELIEAAMRALTG
jgi:AcrR family transcriptional regulator